MPRQHLFVDQTRLPLPILLRLRHCGHGAYQPEIRVALFQRLESFEESCIFGPPVGIKEIHLVRESVVIGLPYDADKWCDSDSTGQEHSRLDRILMYREGT